MLTLAHFNPTVSFPKLKGEYVTVAEHGQCELQRIVTESTVYFLGVVNGQGVAGSCITNNLESYPQVFKEDNLRSAYTTINRMMSYAVAMTPDIPARLALLAELIELTKVLNALPDYTDERVSARLGADPKAAKLEPNPPISDNETVILATELWHVHPAFSEKSGQGTYEGIKLEIMSLWGVEKIRYIITLERGDYKLGTFVDVGFEVDPTPIVNQKLEEFNVIQEFVPFPETVEEADEEV